MPVPALGRISQFIRANAMALVIASGIGLRVKHLLENRPLWLDEACAAVSITSRSFAEIFRNHSIMPEFARPPMVFELVEKMFVSVFGNNETVLRIFPFIAGVAALICFAAIARKFLTPRAALIAVTLFALAEPLVYYSAELKPYAVDLCCAILLIEAARRVMDGGLKPRACWRLGMIGAVLLWLSNAMIFVLAGIGLAVLFERPWTKGRAAITALGAMAAFWAVSFTALYAVSLRHMIGNASITDTWKGAFCTTPVFSFATLAWIWNVFTLSFENPAGLKWTGLMLPLFLIGAVILARGNRRVFLLWFLPVLITLAAALLGKYPFYGRVLLFLTAGYYVFIAAAVDRLLDIPRKFSVLPALIFLAALFYQPVVDAAHYLHHSRSKTDNRSVMAFMAEYYHSGDFVYLGTLAQPPFWYYAGQLGLSLRFPQPVIGYSDGALIHGFRIAKFALDPKEADGREFLMFRSEYNIFNDKGMFRANMGSSKDNQNVAMVPVGSAYAYPPTGRTWLFVSGPSALEAGVNALIVASFNRSARPLLAYESLNAGVYLYDIP
jgi:uncharacterized membrane protein